MKSDNGSIQTDTIREHYNQISSAYGLWWGEHMHHGFWEDGESLAEAQVKLIERLAAHAQVPHFARVLDVGCGLGGASLWLARNLDCSVLGITNSPEQAKIARRRAHAAGFDYDLRFAVMDANQLDLPRESFDVVWVLECSEHLAERGLHSELRASVEAGRRTRPVCVACVIGLRKPRTSAPHLECVSRLSLSAASDHAGLHRLDGGRRL
ncbi:MAG: class I SAM-dependent methyltransferase [Acidobacteria bacterium]|nr:class I SAM-dependent methyltransferase [Acidobacteriota bacterium]